MVHLRTIRVECGEHAQKVCSDKPLFKSGPPSSSATRGNDCAQINDPSERNPEEVMNVDMVGDEKIEDILIPRVYTLPSSLEIDTKIDMSGDIKFDRTDIHISGVVRS